ncbi:MAG: DEAD/DEAH box helicase, partial [Thermoproteus sp.]
RGYLLPANITILRYRPAGCRAEDFVSERRCIVQDDRRNRLIVRLALKAAKPLLLITPFVSHAKALYELIKAEEPSVELVTGAVKGEVRKRIYDALRRGFIKILVATTLADEGLDLPPLTSLIVALGGKSRVRVLQRVGRVERIYPGKTGAYVYDICDTTKYMLRHCEVREELYRSEPMWKISYGNLEAAVS